MWGRAVPSTCLLGLQIAMPHQWLEGNLPVSAKCTVCDKTCGSVLRLQDWRCLWCKVTVSVALGGSGKCPGGNSSAAHSSWCPGVCEGAVTPMPMGACFRCTRHVRSPC